MTEKLKELFEAHFGRQVDKIEEMQAHASKRCLYRIFSGNESYVGVHFGDKEENRAFVGFSRHFLEFGLPVPEIHVVDDGWEDYIEEDFGDTTLYTFLQETRSETDPFPVSVEKLYEKALQELPKFQVQAGKTIDFSLCYQRDAYDRESIMFDLHYFREHFLDRKEIQYDNSRLEADYSRFTDFLLEAGQEYFLYRDFQARNIMVRDDQLYFLDYQAGRRGAPQWDVVSLLYQSQAKVPQDARDRLLEVYLASLGQYAEVDPEKFKEHYQGYVFTRLMQVLGAYGRFGLGEGKEYFLNGIPVAVGSILHEYRTKGFPVQLPEVEDVMKRLEDG